MISPGLEMLKWAKDLFPFCRSITGEGLRDSLKYIKKIHPDLKINSFKTGKKVFDWIVPEEWIIKDAYIEHESGKRFAEFKKNNLSVVNYSTPIKKIMSLDEIKPFIHVQQDRPNAIPYITSYYKKRWGFCMSKNEKNKLPKGKYKVHIDSSFKKGEMNFGEIYIKGSSKKEIFFSTYLCHPSMANNELSGPVLSTALAKYIKNNFKKKKYSYRFLFLTETIGSIAYISKNLKKLKKNVKAGFVLSCVGDERAYSHIESRYGNTLADQALEAAFIGKKIAKKYSYLARGSDERQFCYPGVDLPVVGFCKSKYGNFPEYHTSDDNFDLVTSKGLNDSFNLMKIIIDTLEYDKKFKNLMTCEAQLGKRGLYPSLSQKDSRDMYTRCDVMHYVDGSNNIFQISKIINVSLEKTLHEIKLLKNAKVIR